MEDFKNISLGPIDLVTLGWEKPEFMFLTSSQVMLVLLV